MGQTMCLMRQYWCCLRDGNGVQVLDGELSAVVACNDDMAIGAIKSVKQYNEDRGLNAGLGSVGLFNQVGDFIVIGYDNVSEKHRTCKIQTSLLQYLSLCADALACERIACVTGYHESPVLRSAERIGRADDVSQHRLGRSVRASGQRRLVDGGEFPGYASKHDPHRGFTTWMA